MMRFEVLLCVVVIYIMLISTPILGYPTSNNNLKLHQYYKRPFCNAFTGCGKKRSLEESPKTFNNELTSDDSLASLLDLNSEPAVEDLMRQIMSEAKLWEAIQEANHARTSYKADFNQPTVRFSTQ
ncbi:cardioactive peptide [Culicoides brevitarsis]|uniref:cardioactive peptide n=1 Tax=Culicoides brevitarsis TaxID=469753 RepID=UPI00307B7A75